MRYSSAKRFAARVVSIAGAIVLFPVAACFVGPRSYETDDEYDPSRAPDTDAATVRATGDQDGGVSPSDDSTNGRCIPTDLQVLLDNECSSCHGATPKKGAETILTYGDLVAPSTSGKSVAEESIARMKKASDPMPPSGLLAAADISPLERWVAAGKKSMCPAPGTLAAGSTSDAGAAEAEPEAPKRSVCSSKTFWTKGIRKSQDMYPGVACNTSACHSAGNTTSLFILNPPDFTVAGTVYPTLYEPDNCNGTASPTVKVVITDAKNVTTTLTANSVGNFFTERAFAAPYKVKVVVGTKTLAMKTPLTAGDGDCNSCHTEFGRGNAPGRITIP